MQSSHINGRNNGLVRSHHHHPGHQLMKRDLKLNLNNGKTTLEPSMLRSEEKERQRQEARALRERSRAATHAAANATPAEKSQQEAIFNVVQVTPDPDDQDRRAISEILGDFSQVYKHHKASDLIGVDHQPPTPAPAAAHAAHLHDPDPEHELDPVLDPDLCCDQLPPPTVTSLPPPSFPPPSYSHRQHQAAAAAAAAAASASSRTHKQHQQPHHHHQHHNTHHHSHHHSAAPPPYNKAASNGIANSSSGSGGGGGSHHHHHHQKKKFEEVNPSLKSGPGPGPGPGPGGRGTTTSLPPPSGGGRGRPPRTTKDPQVQKIMSEMSDLKSPVSAILQTPRPDHHHQSSFTFPTPGPPGGPPLPPHHHHQDHIAKAGKSSENRSSSFIPSKTVENEKNNFHNLSEESDEENVTSQVPEKHDPNGGSSGSIQQDHSISNILPTDDSSNSEESSGSDSESSTSDEEGKQSPAPASPTTSDKNPWSLENIFQQSNHQAESVVQESTSKNSLESVKELKTEPIPPSPPTIDEPAPPVVTTVPPHTFTKLPSDARSKGAPHPISSPSSSDESSDEYQSSTIKPKKLTNNSVNNNGRSKQVSPSKMKKIVEPRLSSESEDEDEPPTKTSSKNTVCDKQQQQATLSRSPRAPPSRHHASKKPLKKKETITRSRDSKSTSRVKPAERVIVSDSESEDLSDSSVVLGRRSSSGSKPSSKRTPSIRGSSSRSKNVSGKSGPSAALSSKFPLKKEETTAVAAPTPPPRTESVGETRKRSRKESKHDSVTGTKKEEERSEPIGSGRKTVSEDSRGPLPQSLQQQSKNVRKEKDDMLHQEKKRRKRNHESEMERADSGLGLSGVERGVEQPQHLSSHRQQSSGRSKISLSSVSYEKGVPKLLCSIPCNLIDRLPINNNNSISAKGVGVKGEKVNKEILEMRTSGEVVKEKLNSSTSSLNSSLSPPNEDATKLKIRAICSIYGKRQSSLEPDKVKREASVSAGEPLGGEVSEQQQQQDMAVRSPHTQPQIKQESKPPIKEDARNLTKLSPEGSLKRHGSSSSLSSLGTVASLGSHSHSKRHKKDKRKEKEKSSESESMKRRKRTASPEPEPVVSLPAKKTRERSRENSSSASKGAQSSGPKKLRSTLTNESPPVEGRKEVDACSPTSRSSRSAASEERPPLPPPPPPSAPASIDSTRMRAQHSTSSHFSHKGPLHTSPYLDHESEDELCTGDGSHRSGHTNFSSREKLEENNISNGGDTSEYHSLPSSEHGGSTYRNGEEPSASSLEQQHHLGILGCGGRMYPPEVSPTLEGSNNPVLNRETSNTNDGPVYFSYFERKIPEILKDNTQYLSTAIELKHQADKERHRIIQYIIYLEAVLYFILTAESRENDHSGSYALYKDTYGLLNHVLSFPIFKGPPSLYEKSLGLKDSPDYKIVILYILSLRCQSLMALKLCDMRRDEMKEDQNALAEMFKVNVPSGAGRHQTSSLAGSTPSVSSGAGGGTPSGVAWGGSQRSAANNSPSSLSPTPSPAGSVGSEGSQSSSGYSTEGTRQRAQHPPMGATPPQATGMITVPSEIYALLVRHYRYSSSLQSCRDMWRDADNLIYFHDVRDFFIQLDRKLGPLTLHSSPRELVNYIQTALNKLKNSD